jgi:phosphoenolpyruvate synthase/pyruvate phosphate dikinase
MSDFKTNEYADLFGGRQFEPEENNPLLGFRGASRHYSDRCCEGVALECQAIKGAVKDLIETAHKNECNVGICGQAPSDHTEFAAFLAAVGIGSITVNPDSVLHVTKRVAEMKEKQKKD